MRRCVSDAARSLDLSSIASNSVLSVNTMSANVVLTTMTVKRATPAMPASKKGQEIA